MVSLFCRHNRFTADCPICSRGTVLDSPGSGSGRPAARSAAAGATERPPAAARRSSRAGGRQATARGAVGYRGPYASVGPYERDGHTYEVRLERVPGGLRLAEWAAGQLRPNAPVLAAADVAVLVQGAADSRALESLEHAELTRALADVPPDRAPASAIDPPPDTGASGHGTSPGRSGELRDELRAERLDGGRLRVARWVLRPGTGWDMLDAPTMLPAPRYAEALADAARQGLLGG